MADYPDFEGAKSKLFTVADWAAAEATDKNFRASANDKGFQSTVSVTYEVPTGTTLFITGMCFKILAHAEADGDSNQMGQVYLLANTTVLAQIGGNGGNTQTFPKPMVINAGETFTATCGSGANHSVDLTLTAWGYEI